MNGYLSDRSPVTSVRERPDEEDKFSTSAESHMSNSLSSLQLGQQNRYGLHVDSCIIYTDIMVGVMDEEIKKHPEIKPEKMVKEKKEQLDFMLAVPFCEDCMNNAYEKSRVQPPSGLNILKMSHNPNARFRGANPVCPEPTSQQLYQYKK